MATLTAEPREQSSTNATNRLRKTGMLPMAVIRKNQVTELIQAPNVDVKACIEGQKGLATFDMVHGSETLRVVVKDVQRDAVTRKVIHITVQEILDTDIVKVPVPIKVIGEPPSVTKRAATLMIPMAQITIQSMVKALPDAIEVNVSRMRQNDKILVSDLAWADGVVALTSPGTVLAATKQLRGMAAFDDDAAFAALDKEAAKAAEEGA